MGGIWFSIQCRFPDASPTGVTSSSTNATMAQNDFHLIVSLYAEWSQNSLVMLFGHQWVSVFEITNYTTLKLLEICTIFFLKDGFHLLDFLWACNCILAYIYIGSYVPVRAKYFKISITKLCILIINKVPKKFNLL